MADNEVPRREAAVESALRESEDRLALAMDAAALGIFYAVPYGPMYWSPRCREIFGVGDAPIPDFEAFLKLVHPADREQVREAAARWLDPAGDGRYKDQYRCLRPDGAVRWVAASGIVRLQKIGDAPVPVQLVGTIFDITEQKLAQEQLLLTDRLSSMGLLAAGVAHEINNPLSYLIGALDYLEERRAAGAFGGDAEAGLALGEAREGALRVRQVVRDLKTLSGTREERRARVELRGVVEAAVRMAGNQLNARARVVREYGEAPAVLADEARLAQVALNLIVNAAQAIPEGRPEENEVQLVVGTDPAGRAVFEVRDSGRGIPRELVGRLFEPFTTSKARGVGTGLGLAICRSAVEALGGEISAAPRPGGGTIVRVVLPPGPPDPPQQSSASSGPGPTGRRGRVLVVDDEPSVGLSIRRLLAGEHEVELRTRAEDALDAIGRGERFDAIVCDLSMPGLGAAGLHAALQRVAPGQAARMIVLTGGAHDPAALDFVEEGALPLLEKPIDTATLRRRILEAVADARER